MESLSDRLSMLEEMRAAGLLADGDEVRIDEIRYRVCDIGFAVVEGLGFGEDLGEVA